MCAVIGALIRRVHTDEQRNTVNYFMSTIWELSMDRGRDGRGFLLRTLSGDTVCKSTERITDWSQHSEHAPVLFQEHTKHAVMIANLRAEPTTEFVLDKREEDQQPYTAGEWTIVHNGTIANDAELRQHRRAGDHNDRVDTSIDSAAIAEHLAKPSSYEYRFTHFKERVRELKGSYAILASHKDEPGVLYVACNYRPIWYVETEVGYFFASARDYFPHGSSPQMVTPYSAMRFSSETAPVQGSLRKFDVEASRKALVICSGGLDSVVAAAWAVDQGYDVRLLHFMYGSRAEGPEVKAVQNVAMALDVNVTLFPLPIYNKSDSPLLDPDSKVAGGEEGAEFAHEWVPARNLVLLSVATAFAEANGIETLVLGNNLEEAGAYPDNEPEFISKFNDLLPFAVGDGKRMQVVMPVGNLMKHEIVALGHKLQAPLHLTWSCYRAGQHHCGTCGPCYMRKRAFDINKLPEVIQYVPVD